MRIAGGVWSPSPGPEGFTWGSGARALRNANAAPPQLGAGRATALSPTASRSSL